MAEKAAHQDVIKVAKDLSRDGRKSIARRLFHSEDESFVELKAAKSTEGADRLKWRYIAIQSNKGCDFFTVTMWVDISGPTDANKIWKTGNLPITFGQYPTFAMQLVLQHVEPVEQLWQMFKSGLLWLPFRMASMFLDHKCDKDGCGKSYRVMMREIEDWFVKENDSMNMEERRNMYEVMLWAGRSSTAMCGPMIKDNVRAVWEYVADNCKKCKKLHEEVYKPLMDSMSAGGE